MRELRTDIVIAAPIAKVWGALMDFDNWKDWNPISHANGSTTLGSKINVTMIKEGKRQNQYAPTITALSEPKSLRWRAVMMAGFLFTNDKIFELEEVDNSTRLIHIEEFRGILVLLFWGKLNNGVALMLNAMNSALKAHMEKHDIA